MGDGVADVEGGLRLAAAVGPLVGLPLGRQLLLQLGVPLQLILRLVPQGPFSGGRYQLVVMV